MSLPIPAGRYEIDTLHSQLGFSVTHLGISVVRGTFDRYQGELTVGDTLDECGVEITAEMTSVASGHPAREEYLQGADFFDSENHPTMSYRSTSVTEGPDGYDVTGDLTIRGTTESITLHATFNGSAPFPIDGSTHHGFSAQGTISRSAFGMTFGVPMVTDEVELHLEAQFVQHADE